MQWLAEAGDDAMSINDIVDVVGVDRERAVAAADALCDRRMAGGESTRVGARYRITDVGRLQVAAQTVEGAPERRELPGGECAVLSPEDHEVLKWIFRVGVVPVAAFETRSPESATPAGCPTRDWDQLIMSQHWLVAVGLIEIEGMPDRPRYRLTAKGRERLDAAVEEPDEMTLLRSAIRARGDEIEELNRRVNAMDKRLRVATETGLELVVKVANLEKEIAALKGGGS